MRKDGNVLVLSRRNLESLLYKLDRNILNADNPAEQSACTIVGGSDADYQIVMAEENDVHYTDRPAGRMHDREEEKISKPKTGTARPGIDVGWLSAGRPMPGSKPPLDLYGIEVKTDPSVPKGKIMIQHRDPGDETDG